MSSAELNRFLEDVRKNPCLLDELRTLRHNPEAALLWAVDRGYHLTLGDLAETLDSDRELSDEDLDQAAGGDDNWPLP
ncbi:MAG TPA: Nif11-like leader peptide family RiPP precursor [Thermoanaerobaculia bacterium]|jgi:predicted ribosomally synthesized peptide with nif11-like leader|nr:Nif11-like leader peptide family RiPP precursor [Thermoanaerobaculia bacterium]